MTSFRCLVRSTLLASMAALALSVAPGAAHAQAGKAGAPEAASPPTGPLAPFAWLQGCWQGKVNKREFREYWMPLQGDTMVGVGQLALEGKLNDYEYLRLESRDGSTVFSQFSGERAEISFKLATTTTDAKDTIFTFANTADAFPARLIYRRGGLDGWLYETIEGPLDGANKSVIYPLRRVDCETGEFILK
ncbi:MAG: hypothetical protein KGL70_11510 [Betaproteobacteria bacterium]|nr:hypothetical protein [Betaproteobacteria bacterium]MDE2360000.1 hypothetical protein [Betaproteobacteria bacterium]